MGVPGRYAPNSKLRLLAQLGRASRSVRNIVEWNNNMSSRNKSRLFPILASAPLAIARHTACVRLSHTLLPLPIDRSIFGGGKASRETNAIFKVLKTIFLSAAL